jgi:protein TonB
MPRDLFGAVAARPPSVRSRRAPIVSVIVHTVAITGLIVLSIVGSDSLPAPHEALAFFEMPARIAEVPPPPPPPNHHGKETQPQVLSANSGAAPVVAPEGIREETGLEERLLDLGRGIDGGIVDTLGVSATHAFEAPPPPPPAPAAPVRLHSGIRAPSKVLNVPPVYPELARRAGIEGIVILEATIDAQGHVVSATVLRSVPLLDQSALEAVRQWTFSPALLNGVPVPVIMTVTVRFQLKS